LLVGGIVLLKNAPQIIERSQRLYWARQCAAHITPPGTLLIEADPVKGAQLIASNPDYVADGTQLNSFRGMGSASAAPSGAAVYWPREFRQFARLMPAPSFAPITGFYTGRRFAVAFMGERVSHSGNHRLIVIPIAAIVSDDVTMYAEIGQACIVARTDLSGSGEANWATPFRYMHVGHIEPMSIQLLQGVADPVDRSCITIDYDAVRGWNNTKYHGTLDVYLCDDDSIKVVFRYP